jgi:hypothetical protein
VWHGIYAKKGRRCYSSERFFGAKIALRNRFV